MKVWITKYALTKGIFTIEATEPNENGLITPINKLWDCYHGEGREWHRTKEAAIERAEEMRLKKIASLEKQIDKIKKLNFEGTCK